MSGAALRTIEYLDGLAAITTYNPRRFPALCAALGDVQTRVPALHVAGTNGKGSVCAFSAAALEAQGYRTGLFVSPHLTDVRERIRINGEMVAEAAFFDAVQTVRRAERALRPAWGVPALFEVLTAAALLLFDQAGVEMAVMETGLGGRKDPTRLVDAKVCCITAIALDHTRLLGDTLGAIAREKAGILKRGVPAVFAPQAPAADAALCRAAEAVGAPYRRVCPQALRIRQNDLWARRMDLELFGLSLVDAHVSLLGAHQFDNAAAAAAACHALGVSPAAIREGLATASWPGRLQRLRLGEREILLDGAHNPSGAAALAAAIRAYYPGRKVILVLGAHKNKDVDGMLRCLVPVADSVVATRATDALAMQATDLMQRARALGAKAFAAADIKSALAAALDASGEKGLAVVCGSLYMVGEALSLLAPIHSTGIG